MCVSDPAQSGQGCGIYVREKVSVLYLIMHASVCVDLNHVSKCVIYVCQVFFARRESGRSGHSLQAAG